MVLTQPIIAGTSECNMKRAQPVTLFQQPVTVTVTVNLIRQKRPILTSMTLSLAQDHHMPYDMPDNHVTLA